MFWGVGEVVRLPREVRNVSAVCCHNLTSNRTPGPTAGHAEDTVRKEGFLDVRKNTCLVVEVREWGLSPIRTNFLVLRTKGIGENHRDLDCATVIPTRLEPGLWPLLGASVSPAGFQGRGTQEGKAAKAALHSAGQEAGDPHPSSAPTLRMRLSSCCRELSSPVPWPSGLSSRIIAACSDADPERPRAAGPSLSRDDQPRSLDCPLLEGPTDRCGRARAPPAKLDIVQSEVRAAPMDRNNHQPE